MHYREQIARYQAKIKWIKPNAPAEEAEIVFAEQQLQVSFPPELRAFLQEMNGDHYLMFSVDEMLDTIRTVREGLSECYDGLEQYLFFAGNGCGDYYCYRIAPQGNVQPTPLYRWEHETNEAVQVADHLHMLIDRYYNDEI